MRDVPGPAPFSVVTRARVPDGFVSHDCGCGGGDGFFLCGLRELGVLLAVGWLVGVRDLRWNGGWVVGCGCDGGGLGPRWPGNWVKDWESRA